MQPQMGGIIQVLIEQPYKQAIWDMCKVGAAIKAKSEDGPRNFYFSYEQSQKIPLTGKVVWISHKVLSLKVSQFNWVAIKVFTWGWTDFSW